MLYLKLPKSQILLWAFGFRNQGHVQLVSCAVFTRGKCSTTLRQFVRWNILSLMLFHCDTVVYTIDIVTLTQLLERKSIHSLHSLLKQTLKRVQAWKNKNPRILLFKPLLEVLQQWLKHLETGFNRAHGRKLKISAVPKILVKIFLQTLRFVLINL